MQRSWAIFENIFSFVFYVLSDKNSSILIGNTHTLTREEFQKYTLYSGSQTAQRCFFRTPASNISSSYSLYTVQFLLHSFKLNDFKSTAYVHDNKSFFTEKIVKILFWKLINTMFWKNVITEGKTLSRKSWNIFSFFYV